MNAPEKNFAINEMTNVISDVLKKSMALPWEVKHLPIKQQEGVQNYINKGYKFIRIEHVKSAYRRVHQYVILASLDNNIVTINKNGNNRNMYGY